MGKKRRGMSSIRLCAVVPSLRFLRARGLAILPHGPRHRGCNGAAPKPPPVCAGRETAAPKPVTTIVCLRDRQTPLTQRDQGRECLPRPRVLAKAKVRIGPAMSQGPEKGALRLRLEAAYRRMHDELRLGCGSRVAARRGQPWGSQGAFQPKLRVPMRVRTCLPNNTRAPTPKSVSKLQL